MANATTIGLYASGEISLGKAAEREDADTVTDDHIEEVRELVQRGRLSNRIRDQTDHTQYILETIAHLENDSETPA